jgi:hypothetical protein
MTLYPNDADRTNDTICTQFSVIDRLKGDIYVGVDQRFPSIHAAVDSLRFRGVGSNVRLILTDNNYTETGTHPSSYYSSRVSNYVQTNFIATWTDIASTGTVFIIPSTSGTDYGSIPLPFDFPYDGAIIPAGTILHAGIDGAIGVDPNVILPSSAPTVPVAVGNPAFPALLAFFQGGGFNSGATYYYQVDGTAPNRVLTIEYSGWFRYYNPTILAHIQVKLYETTGQIEFIYLEHNLNMGKADGVSYYNCIGLNGLNGATHPSAIYFASQAYPGYTALQASTPATDIRWQAVIEPGMLDFGGIRGLADTASVTWMPNAGIQPRITFTGTEPFCFYFGDQFGGYMTFEGYNPSGAPIPDKFVPEPNKRGIAIVNNSVAAGGIFAFEEGASNITLKDLVMKNNGLFSNDSDVVVRLYNEQNRILYTGRTGVVPITDTVPIQTFVSRTANLAMRSMASGTMGCIRNLTLASRTLWIGEITITSLLAIRSVLWQVL